ncbi:AlpA family phage regulatory protein [Ramlibacter sp.]|uniref:helix-turn-helix transcriptional regulator n=1 Tax=Ramlibacter sp. TaxID=1917967 RepID=UPI00260276DD|nr:AlpA family phage regulatory protein [Ramlibacter sp.]MDB5956752.1 AlpA family phage regulatory protein [Ramlibacter sp.]
MAFNPPESIPASHLATSPVEQLEARARVLPLEGFIRQSALIPGIVPFSAATLWRKVKSKDFPAPVKLSERVTAWRVQDVRAWLQRPR